MSDKPSCKACAESKEIRLECQVKELENRLEVVEVLKTPVNGCNNCPDREDCQADFPMDAQCVAHRIHKAENKGKPPIVFVVMMPGS